VAALGALASTVIVPAWGHLSDSLLGRARAFRIGLLVAAGISAALLFQPPLWAAAAMFATFTVFATMFIALADAQAVIDLPAPERQYGALRAHASLAFTVGIIAVGFVYSWGGYGIAPGFFLICVGTLLLLVGRIKGRAPARSGRATSLEGTRAGAGAGVTGAQNGVSNEAEREPRFGSLGRAFAVQPRLWLLLAVFTFAYVGVQGAMTFVGVRIVDVGGKPSDVALSFGLSSAGEIPGLLGAGWLGRRIGLRWLFGASTVVYGLFILSWGILPYALAISATRLATGVCSGPLMAARVLIVRRLLPGSLQVTGQVLFQSATMGIGTILGSVVGGVVYASFGPTFFFLAAGAVAIAGGIAAWFFLAGPVGARLTSRGADQVDLDELTIP